MKKNELIKFLAWSAIKSKLGLVSLVSKYDVVKLYPEFVLPGATFITLKKQNKLRGCIGSLSAHSELYNDIVVNSRKAAFNDPRFNPITSEELESLSLEVSILSPTVLVKYTSLDDLKSKIQVGVDGIILKFGSNQATFLPQVWEELPSFELFFERLCKKASLNEGCLKNHPQIYKYQVEKVK